MLRKILRLFFNKLTTDDKHSLLNRDDFTQPIQMLVSQKKKTFSRFFSAFLKFSLNFEYFFKKGHPHRRCISEITDSAKSDYINVEKVPFPRLLQQATWLTGANRFAIWTTAPLPDLLIIVNVIELEKVSFNAAQNLKTVF